jgi:deoxyribose-phosphate aldolase
MNKYTELFKKYTSYNDKQVTEETAKIISENSAKNNTAAVYKNIFGLLDLTSLNNTDTELHIRSLVEKVNNLSGKYKNLPNVAAICVYPSMVSVVKDALTVSGVEIASVAAGFPSPQTFLEVKIAETAMAVMEGATEIDMVFPIDKFLEEKYEELSEEIMEVKASCRKAKLKVILETGTLKTAENISKATLLSIASGADFVKTSTGKNDTGATLEAVYVMCKVIKEFEQKNNIKTGIKVSGGVSTVENAVEYYTLVGELLGKDYLNKEFFRIGTSKLANGLLSVIEGKEEKYF